MTTDCKKVEELLLDLLEIEALSSGSKEIEEAQKHVLHCSACRANLEKLRKGQHLAMMLPLEEPPSYLTERILLRARNTSSGTRKPKLMRWALDLRPAHQLAMAAVVVLCVTTGLWKFPRKSGVSEEAVDVSDTNADKVAEQETAAAPTEPTIPESAPAFDGLDERLANRPREKLRQARSNAGAGRLSPQKEIGFTKKIAPSLGDDVGESASSFARTESRAEEAHSVPSTSRFALSPNAGAGAAAGGTLARAAQAPAAQAPSSAHRGAVAAEAGEEYRAAAPARDLAIERAQTESPPRAEAREAERAYAARPAVAAPEPANPTVYRTGVERFEAHDYEGAIQFLTRAVQTSSRSNLPNALEYLARSYRAKGDYAHAISTYQRCLSLFPSHLNAPRLMRELADCYRELGRTGEAQTWETRAREAENN